MEEKKKGIISEPDENGIRYYTFGQSEGRSPLPPSQEDSDEKKEAFAGGGSGGQGGSPRRNRKKPFIILGCILLAVILLGVACGSLFEDEDSNYADIREDHISVLYIEGTIGEDSSDGYNHQ